MCCAGELLPGQAQHAQQQASVPTEYCSTILAMMSWDHLDSDLCQHVITLINRALDSPDGPHKGSPKCLVLRQRLVNALLDRGLMRVITDLEDLVQQESLFQVSHHFDPAQATSMLDVSCPWAWFGVSLELQQCFNRCQSLHCVFPGRWDVPCVALHQSCCICAAVTVDMFANLLLMCF